ncbi:hypothetical protein, partial [Burkholderia pseudomallei]|uniref:hypothetical protein n=1 Tax=Burkholderia pseudomallei TaxID=28450 RepID=UPI001C4C99D3
RSAGAPPAPARRRAEPARRRGASRTTPSAAGGPPAARQPENLRARIASPQKIFIFYKDLERMK